VARLTDTPAEPEGGWAETPRPPVTAVLSEDDVRRLTAVEVRASELPPLVWRVAVSLALGLLLAITWHPAVGAAAAVALLALAGTLFVLRRRAVERSLTPGSARTTGYDRQGALVLAGSRTTVLPRGCAARVTRRDGVALVRPRGRGARPVVLLDDLLTPADEAVLTTDPRAGGGHG